MCRTQFHESSRSAQSKRTLTQEKWNHVKTFGAKAWTSSFLQTAAIAVVHRDVNLVGEQCISSLEPFWNNHLGILRYTFHYQLSSHDLYFHTLPALCPLRGFTSATAAHSSKARSMADCRPRPSNAIARCSLDKIGDCWTPEQWDESLHMTYTLYKYVFIYLFIYYRCWYVYIEKNTV